MVVWQVLQKSWNLKVFISTQDIPYVDHLQNLFEGDGVIISNAMAHGSPEDRQKDISILTETINFKLVGPL